MLAPILLSLAACSATSVPQEPVKTKPANVEIDFMFKMNQKRLSETAMNYIKNLSTSLKVDEIDKITIVGFTDQTGTQIKNVKISNERSQEIKKHFNQNGVPEEKMVAYGLGKVNLKENCLLIKDYKARFECHDKNRRVEVTISY